MLTVYDGFSEKLPEGYEAVTIRLDGSSSSDLDWAPSLAKAEGKKVLWELNLGLFDSLRHPLGSEMQLKTLGLALNHFFESVWNESHLGVILYRGSADFSRAFPWDAEQEENFLSWLKDFEGGVDTPLARKLFCRDACTEYLNLLQGFLPDEVPTYLLYDCSGLEEIGEAALLLDPERTARFLRILKEAPLGHREGIWETAKAPLIDHALYLGTGAPLQEKEPAAYGVFLPTMHEYFTQDLAPLEKGIQWLREKGLPYRLLTEEQLISDWDGLDYLLVAPALVNPMAFRKLRGFVAAGGTVVSLGKPLGLEIETTLDI